MTDRQRHFTFEGAMKAARGFHHAAAQLNAVQIRAIPQVKVLDEAAIEQLVGQSAGAVVLEALAVECATSASAMQGRRAVRVPPATTAAIMEK